MKVVKPQLNDDFLHEEEKHICKQQIEGSAFFNGSPFFGSMERK